MTRSRILTLAMILSLVACTAAEPPRATTVPDVTWEQIDTADGATLYANLCASCHGPGGRGDGPMAEVMNIAMSDLTSLSARNGGRFPLAHVEGVIYGKKILPVHGSAEMPMWGPALEGVFDHLPYVNREAFAAQRIRRISRHLESLQTAAG